MTQYASDKEDPVPLFWVIQILTFCLTTRIWIKSAFNQSHVKNLSEGKDLGKLILEQIMNRIHLSRYHITGLGSHKDEWKKSKTFTPTKARLKIGNNE